MYVQSTSYVQCTSISSNEADSQSFCAQVSTRSDLMESEGEDIEHVEFNREKEPEDVWTSEDIDAFNDNPSEDSGYFLGAYNVMDKAINSNCDEESWEATLQRIERRKTFIPRRKARRVSSSPEASPTGSRSPSSEVNQPGLSEGGSWTGGGESGGAGGVVFSISGCNYKSPFLQGGPLTICRSKPPAVPAHAVPSPQVGRTWLTHHLKLAREGAACGPPF